MKNNVSQYLTTTSKLVFCAILLAFAGSLAAQEMLVTFGPEDPITVLEHGEVRIRYAETLYPEAGGHAIQISFAFPSLDHYERAMVLGAQKIDLTALESVILGNEDGEIEEFPAAGFSPFDLAELANGNVCGDVFARAAVELEPDIWVGIGMHGGSGRSAFTVPPTPEKCARDVFDQCPFFAFWGNCKSDGCTNTYGREGEDTYNL